MIKLMVKLDVEENVNHLNIIKYPMFYVKRMDVKKDIIIQMESALNVLKTLNIVQIVLILLHQVVKKKDFNVFFVKVDQKEFIEYGKVMENAILVMDLQLIVHNAIMKKELIKLYVINVATVIIQILIQKKNVFDAIGNLLLEENAIIVLINKDVLVILILL